MNRRGFVGSLLAAVGAAKAISLPEKPKPEPATEKPAAPKGLRLAGYDVKGDKYLLSDGTWVPVNELLRAGHLRRRPE